MRTFAAMTKTSSPPASPTPAPAASPSVDGERPSVVRLGNAAQEIAGEADHLGAHLPRGDGEPGRRPARRPRLPRPGRRQALLRLGHRRAQGPQPEGEPADRRHRRPLLRRLVQPEGRAAPGHGGAHREGPALPEDPPAPLREVPAVPRRGRTRGVGGGHRRSDTGARLLVGRRVKTQTTGRTGSMRRRTTRPRVRTPGAPHTSTTLSPWTTSWITRRTATVTCRHDMARFSPSADCARLPAHEEAT